MYSGYSLLKLLSTFRQVTNENSKTDSSENKKLSYRKQIVHKLRTQYVEGIYSNFVALQSRLGVTQCH